MKTELLYELYEITEKNDAPDLATVGMAMLREKYPEITHEEAKEMREFTGRHGQELAAAYEAVDHVVLDRGVYDQAFEQLKPYVRGEADLDACLAQAQRAVRFYFDE
mgnify:CR=1 FL=1